MSIIKHCFFLTTPKWDGKLLIITKYLATAIATPPIFLPQHYFDCAKFAILECTRQISCYGESQKRICLITNMAYDVCI